MIDQELIAKLKPPHREIIQAQGTYKQISEALNIPLGTVRSRLHRARAALLKIKRATKVLSR